MADDPEDGVYIRWIGGERPVQGDGTIDGHAFYFRARWDSWKVEIAKTEFDLDNDKLLWSMERSYGQGPYAAGRMSETEARQFIMEAAKAFRESWLDPLT